MTTVITRNGVADVAVGEGVSRYQIPLLSWRNATGLVMTATEVAGGFKIVPGGWGDGGLYLQGEEAGGAETETSDMMVEFALPPEYIAAGALDLVAHAKLTKDANCELYVIDCEAYELDDEGVASSIRASNFEALGLTYGDHTFALTATNLLPGDKILVMLRTTIQNLGGGDASRSFIGSTELQLTSKAV